MRLSHWFITLAPLAAACACGAPQTPSTQPNTVPTMSTPPASSAPATTPPPTISGDVDPVATGMTATGITKLCDDHIAKAKLILDSIKSYATAPDDQLTWGTTLGQVDNLNYELALAAAFPGLMAVGHPDKKVREAARACDPKIEKFSTEMMLDATFAKVIKRYGAKKEPLKGTRARLLKDMLRDFHRNGLDLPADKQQRLREINDELAKLEQDFGKNLANAKLKILVKPRQLAGLPKPFIKGHKPDEKGFVTLTTNYPDYFPVLSYCEDRSVAKRLTEKFDNRAADKNMPILSKVLDLRNEKAHMLGYQTWADYAIEPRMAKTAKRVRDFLHELSAKLKEPAAKEYAEFAKEYRRLGHNPGKRIPNYDRMFIGEKLRARKYHFDSKKLSEYLEVSAVTQGLLKTVSKLYGLQFKEVSDAPKWHKDVKVLDVIDGGHRLGRIYLDLYPREGKYKHAAMFEIRTGKQLADGKYVAPMAALMCNFPNPGRTDSPALMTHNEVTTFFHEFGHVMHHILTKQPLATYAGTNTARDFVEAPSQMFEEWPFQREVLDQFAKHYKTGKPIPKTLYEGLIRSRSFGRALSTERQVSLASLDFAYHTHATPMDTDKVFNEVMEKTQRFAYLPDTHFQATFGHLMGYDAGYYGYQWALAIARDVLTRFQKTGFFDAKTAADWRHEVLEQGAGTDENDLVKTFLGRPYNLDAYSKFLQGK